MRRFARRLSTTRLGTAAIAGLLGAACASTGTAPVESATGTRQSTVGVDGGAGRNLQVALTHNDAAVESDLAVSPDRAYAVLPLVYDQLGLKVNTVVSDTRTIGVNAVRMRRVGKDALSRFVSCGTDVTGMSLADSYAVTLTVMSRVTPSGTTGALLGTQVLASAQPMSTSGTVVTCQSTGLLEDRIAKAVALQIAAPTK
ncbi:hypothetical protein tb265_02960 [Gemmatimonadetes bacterium T265]|nr:hypothetical protein tb265_02960 [Gemmatimonadetes bacterium T265]